MKIPNKIKITGKDYTVTYDRDDADKHNYWGYSNFGRQLIKLEPDTHQQNQEESLLHEIIHLVSDTLDSGLTEKQVKQLSRQLYQVLKDNFLNFGGKQ